MRVSDRNRAMRSTGEEFWEGTRILDLSEPAVGSMARTGRNKKLRRTATVGQVDSLRSRIYNFPSGTAERGARSGVFPQGSQFNRPRLAHINKQGRVLKSIGTRLTLPVGAERGCFHFSVQKPLAARASGTGGTGASLGQLMSQAMGNKGRFHPFTVTPRGITFHGSHRLFVENPGAGVQQSRKLVKTFSNSHGNDLPGNLSVVPFVRDEMNFRRSSMSREE